MPQVMAVAAIVSAVVSVVGMVQGMQAAKKQEKLQKQRLDLEKRQRDLEAARQRATLARQARAQRSKMANSAASQGVLSTTSFAGAFGAVGQNQARELGYLEQGLQLAAEGDSITQQQISLDASIAKRNAISQGIKGVTGAVGNFQEAGGINTLTSMFGGSSDPMNSGVLGSPDTV